MQAIDALARNIGLDHKMIKLMKKRLALGASTIAVSMMLGGSALAADALEVSAPQERWEGLYIGGHLGYGEATDYTFDSTDQNINDGNLLGGMQIGYNWQDDNIVYGLQVDGSAIGLEGGDNDYIYAETNFLGSLRGRLGVNVDDNYFLYATGGVGFVQGDAASSTTPTSRESFLEPVYVVGAGFEAALDDRVSVGAEALYYGETGTFSGGDDSGKIDGIMTARVFFNVKLNGGDETSYGLSAAEQSMSGRWQGLYLGGHLGYGEVSDYSFDSSTDENSNEGNFVGGLQLGYNWQDGDIVWGVEADVSATGMEIGDWDYAYAELDYLASVRGRVGMDIGDALIYATGGAGFISGISASSTTPHNKSSLSEFTWVAGAGAELALDDRVSLGAEALYYGETGTFSAGDDSGKIDGIWVGRVRLSVKIGG